MASQLESLMSEWAQSQIFSARPRILKSLIIEVKVSLSNSLCVAFAKTTLPFCFFPFLLEKMYSMILLQKLCCFSARQLFFCHTRQMSATFLAFDCHGTITLMKLLWFVWLSPTLFKTLSTKSES